MGIFHIFNYNNILRIISIIFFLVILIFFGRNIYDFNSFKNKNYNTISISCKKMDNLDKYTMNYCGEIFDKIYEIFFQISVDKKLLKNFYERKINTYLEYDKGFVKSQKGYFNFYIFKNIDDENNLNKFLNFIQEIRSDNKKIIKYEKETLNIKDIEYKENIFNEKFLYSKEYLESENDLELEYKYGIFLNINFE